MQNPFLSKGYSAFGANMGRRNEYPEDTAEPVKLHLTRMRMTDGGCYDEGGAYWGASSPEFGSMYVAWVTPHHVKIFVRGRDHAEAKAGVLAKLERNGFTKVSFYR